VIHADQSSCANYVCVRWTPVRFLVRTEAMEGTTSRDGRSRGGKVDACSRGRRTVTTTGISRLATTERFVMDRSPCEGVGTSFGSINILLTIVVAMVSQSSVPAEALSWADSVGITVILRYLDWNRIAKGSIRSKVSRRIKPKWERNRQCHRLSSSSQWAVVGPDFVGSLGCRGVGRLARFTTASNRPHRHAK
jgi:hypothetical protein